MPVVERKTIGNRVVENVPDVPAELIERLNRYQNTRDASVSGWTRDGCLLVSTRFAETSQVHRVCAPLGMREQLTFYPEPVAGVVPAPKAAAHDGFVYAKDRGGDEFSQLYWFDASTRASTLLSNGKRSQNGDSVFNRDGSLMAYTSTARNGTDHDIWLHDMRTGQARILLQQGGSWTAHDFSSDGKRLLVSKRVSANESYPGEVDVASGQLIEFPVAGGKAAFADFAYAADDAGVYYVSDEPIADQPSEFRTLRYRSANSSSGNSSSGNTSSGNSSASDSSANNSGTIPQQLSTAAWDVDSFELSDDGQYLAYVSNEDGINKLTVLTVPGHAPVRLPELPIGLISELKFSPDSKRLALTLHSAASPRDAYVVDLASAKLERWTRSEVGGLDSARFGAPALVRFPTFDQIAGRPRTIPAFYYQPAKPAPGGKYPVIINIHGGPEGQAQPSFNPTTQFLLNELGIAVLVPNVRGSSGYGKTYLTLDNAEKREDSVKDIGALLDWIAQQPELDAQRIGVVGGSYGGYMVLSSLMHYSDRIRAGIDIVGISDFTTFLTNTESYRRDLRRVEYGDEREPEMKAVFERISPLKNAAKIKTPLFIAHGKNDPRVPYTEAEQIAKAVRANGEPVWFLMFDDEGHGFRKKANADLFGAVSVLFWQKHLLGREQQSTR